MYLDQYYTYYETPIKVIGIITYNKFIEILKRNKYNSDSCYAFKLMWINSWCHKLEYCSVADIYTIIKSMGADMDDQFILDSIKAYNYNESKHWTIEIKYDWKINLLYKDFHNKQMVDKIKRKIINFNIRNKVSEEKKNLVINYINSNKDISKNKLHNKIKKEVCLNTFNKIIKENGINIKNESKSNIILKSLIDTLNYNDLSAVKLNKIITYQYISEKSNLSVKTVNRFFNSNPEYKLILTKYNLNVKYFNDLYEKFKS